MKQDISVVKSRSVTLTVYLENQDGSTRSLSSDETLIFGVKESLSDTAYKIKKTAGSTNRSNGAYSFTLVSSDTSNLIITISVLKVEMITSIAKAYGYEKSNSSDSVTYVKS